MKLKLLIKERDSDSFTVIQARGSTCMLGRRGCDILVPDLYCSQRHALLYQGPRGELRIRDLQSKNGTYVGGKQINDCSLRAGDEIKIGKVYFKVFEFVPDRVEPARASRVADPIEFRDNHGTHTQTQQWPSGERPHRTSRPQAKFR